MLEMTKDSLELEITSTCTLECPGCSRVNTRGIERSNWDKGHLDFDLIKSIIVNSDFKSYNLIGCYGDAIYHPQFWEVVQVLCDEKKSVMLHTNGSSRSAKWWSQANKITGFNKHRFKFYFAIDGLEDTNHYYRINAKWKTIVTGLETMANLENGPDVIWRMLDFKYNKHQQKEAEELAKHYNMKFELHPTFRNAIQYNHADPGLFV